MEKENKRATYYLPTIEGMKKAAKEDHEEMNGALIEQMFWKEHAGSNAAFQDIIKRLYHEDCTLKEALVEVIRYIMYSGDAKDEYFDVLPLIARDACINSVWQKEGNIYFSVDLQETCKRLYEPVERNYMDLLDTDDYFCALAEGRDQYIEYDGSGNLSDDYSADEKVEIEDYLDMKNFKNQAEHMIKSEVSSPSELLSFIIENWNFYYDKPETYAAVLFCLEKSLSVEDNSILRKRLRDFGRLYSEVKDCYRKVSRVIEVKEKRWNERAIGYIEE